MKLPPFEMHRPTSTDETVEMLEGFGDAAALYCGGTELLLVMKLGFTDLSHLIDVKGLDHLRTITLEDRSLRIGAAVTHREIESHPLVLDHAPALATMIRRIANVRVRSVGSLGGNLAFADPASDPATFLTAVGASVDIRGPGGSTRNLPVEDLWVGPYQTALRVGELIEAVIVPPAPEGTVTIHDRLKFQERPAITVTVSARSDGGSIVAAHVAVGAIVPLPARFGAAEHALGGAERGSVATRAAQAGDLAAAAARILEDPTNGEAHKRQLTRVLVARTATQAMEAALAM